MTVPRCRCGMSRPGRMPRGACARCPDCGSGIAMGAPYPEPVAHSIQDGACRLCGLAEASIREVARVRGVAARVEAV